MSEVSSKDVGVSSSVLSASSGIFCMDVGPWMFNKTLRGHQQNCVIDALGSPIVKR